MSAHVAVDIGGTFTDEGTGEVGVAKASTPPGRFENGVMDASTEPDLDGVGFLAHGTTAMINALTDLRLARMWSQPGTAQTFPESANRRRRVARFGAVDRLMAGSFDGDFLRGAQPELEREKQKVTSDRDAFAAWLDDISAPFVAQAKRCNLAREPT